jgi:hypothetical protein
MPEVRLNSAAGPLPTPFRHAKTHPISAVRRRGQIGFKELF